MPKLIHPDLSYDVQGLFMDIYNAHGPMLHEAIYENLLVHLMRDAGYDCRQQETFPVRYKDVHIGNFRTDVTLLPRLLIEIKVAPRIRRLHIAQTITYLKITEADLGIIVNFGGPSVQFKRVPNYISEKETAPPSPSVPVDRDLLHPELTAGIRACLYEVHSVLGPGFWHRVYRDATKVELHLRDLHCEHRQWMDIYHDGWHAGRQRCNVLIVEESVMLTPIAVRAITGAMREQFKAHLRRLGLTIGLMANFHNERLEIETIVV